MTETIAPLSTQPAPPPPAGGSMVALLRRSWRYLTSMRTALLLLSLLALAAVPGSLLPQRGISPDKVAAFYTAHPALAPLLNRLSLFDVFAAPWFAAIYLLLFVSLAGCVVPRLRLHAGALFAKPPRAPRHLRRLAVCTGWVAETPAHQAIHDANALLKRKRFRTAVRDEGGGVVSLAAEKGYLRETGNLLFHSSLLVLLGGVALGGLYGYKGDRLVVEGDGFSNSLAAYDEFHPGRLFSTGQLAPFTVTLDRFSAAYQPNGEPKTFDAFVSYRASPNSPMRHDDIRVNSPLQVGGAKVYLVGHGYAPHFVVHGPDGAVVFDASVPFLPRDGDFDSDGVVKVPDISPSNAGVARQLGFTGFFTPTTVGTAAGIASAFPQARAPAVTLLAWQGDLGVDSGRPQSVYSLDTTRMHRLANAAGQPVIATLRPGQTMSLPGGAGAVTFTGYQQWATFQVTHDPGKNVSLVAAVLVIVGLLCSMRVRRRRVWVRARPADSGRSVVEAGGLARSDADGFAEEFRALVDGLRGGREDSPGAG